MKFMITEPTLRPWPQPVQSNPHFHIKLLHTPMFL